MTVIEPGTVRVSANGVDFAVLSLGPPEGPLALCLHGFPDTAWTWRHLMVDLAGAGYRVAAPWLRGYTPTSVPTDGRYQTGVLATDANALHAALGGDGDAVLIGHDWGALAAYGAAAHQPYALAAGRDHGGATRRVGGRGLSQLRAAQAQLVHVLLPEPAGGDGRGRRRLPRTSGGCGRTGHPAMTEPRTWPTSSSRCPTRPTCRWLIKRRSWQRTAGRGTGPRPGRRSRQHQSSQLFDDAQEPALGQSRIRCTARGRCPQGDVAAGVAGPLGGGDDHAEAGRVHEIEPLDVEHDVVAPLVEQAAELIAQAGGVVDVDLAPKIDHHLAVGRVVTDLEVQAVGTIWSPFLEPDGVPGPGVLELGAPATCCHGAYSREWAGGGRVRRATHNPAASIA